MDVDHVRWIHNPHSMSPGGFGFRLDQKFTNSADSGLDWIQKCAIIYSSNIYGDLRQFLLGAYLLSSLSSALENLQLYTSSFVFIPVSIFTRSFGRYLSECCVLDWTGLDSDSGSSAGLDLD